MTIPKGTISSAIFLLIPLSIWCIYQPPTLNFFALGQILGVTGFTAFTFALLLSIRVPLQEKIFGDIGKSYAFHQTLGTIALMMLALHPVFLAWQYFTFSPRSAAIFLLPVGDIAKIIGVISLYILAVCLVCTYYLKLSYSTWKTTHKFLGVAFILGGLHSVLIVGDIQSMPFLKAIFYLFLILGLGAVSYRILFERIFVRRKTYIVSHVAVVNNRFIDVTLKPKDQAIAVLPGQFVYVTYVSKTVKQEEHPFSIAGTNIDGTLRVIAKKLGDFTNTLSNLAVGDEALVEGPYGKFSFTQGGTTQCWIAGGIGITPFLAFAEALPYTHSATLVYTISNDQENAVAQDLKRLQKEKPNLRVIVWNTEKQGFCTAKEALDGFEISTVDVFLCGPSGMVSPLQEQLVMLGVPRHHIHQEQFSMFLP